jgi:hypothetical protein
MGYFQNWNNFKSEHFSNQTFFISILFISEQFRIQTNFSNMIFKILTFNIFQIWMFFSLKIKEKLSKEAYLAAQLVPPRGRAPFLHGAGGV